MEAANALGKIGDWGAAPTLRRALEPGENLAVLRAATWALRQLGDSQAVFPLCDLLRACSGEGLDLGFVAEALGDFEGPTAVEALCRVLDDPDARTAEAAAESLGRIGDPEALDALIRASGAHHGIWVRDASIGAMGRIGTSRALRPLVRLLSDCSEPTWLRAAAAHALAEARLTDAVPALLKALGDGEPGVVCAAIRALSILEIQGAILPICRVMIARHDLSLDEVKMALGGIPRAKLVEALNAALGIQDASVSEDMAEALMGIWDSLPEKPLRRLLQSPDARVSGWAKTVWEYCQE
jgi:HEAT repeat protein